MDLNHHCCCNHLVQSALGVQIGGVSWQQQFEDEGPLQTRTQPLNGKVYVHSYELWTERIPSNVAGEVQIENKWAGGHKKHFAYGILTPENLRCAYHTGTT